MLSFLTFLKENIFATVNKDNIESIESFLKNPENSKLGSTTTPKNEFPDSTPVHEVFDPLDAKTSHPEQDKEVMDKMEKYMKFLTGGGKSALEKRIKKDQSIEADKLGLKGAEKKAYIDNAIKLALKQLNAIKLKTTGVTVHRASVDLMKQNEFYVLYVLRKEADRLGLEGESRKRFIKDGMNKFRTTYKFPETALTMAPSEELTADQKKILDNAAYVYDVLNNKVKDNTQNKEIGIEGLKRMITLRPQTFGSMGILSQNAKMKKTKFLNFSIPALRALVVNEDTNELVIINTCPGAGSCQLDCYALKNRYIASMEPGMRQARTLNYMMNDVEGFLRDVNQQIAKAHTKYTKEGAKLYIRWHDAGDFFSTRYYNMFIDRIVKQHPDVEFYVYTKIGDIAKSTNYPDNFTINFSLGAKPEELQKVDLKNVKYSVITSPTIKENDPKPKKTVMDFFKRFYDIRTKKGAKSSDDPQDKYDKWDFYSPKHEKEFKEWIAKKWNRDVNKILTYEEFESMPVGKPLEYDVIVTPKNGDIPATRKDVHVSFLLWH